MDGRRHFHQTDSLLHDFFIWHLPGIKERVYRIYRRAQLFRPHISGYGCLWTQIPDDQRAVPRISVHSTSGNVSHCIIFAENKQITICIISVDAI